MDELPKEYLEAIGLIVIKHGIVDRNLMTAISQLVGIDSSISKRLISGESFDVLLSKYKKLLFYKLDNKKLLDKSIKKEYGDVSKLLEKINLRRNELMHSRWYIENGNLIVHKYLLRIGNNPSVSREEKITLQILNNFIKEILDVREQFRIFNKKIIKLLSE